METLNKYVQLYVKTQLFLRNWQKTLGATVCLTQYVYHNYLQLNNSNQLISDTISDVYCSAHTPGIPLPLQLLPQLLSA